MRAPLVAAFLLAVVPAFAQDDPLHHTLSFTRDGSSLYVHARVEPLVRLRMDGRRERQTQLPARLASPVVVTADRSAAFATQYGTWTHEGTYDRVRLVRYGLDTGNEEVFRALPDAELGIAEQGVRTSPGGRYLAVATATRRGITLRIFETRTHVAAYTGPVEDVALLDDTNAAVVLPSGEVQFIELPARRTVARVPAIPGVHRHVVQGLRGGLMIFEERNGEGTLVALRLNGEEIERDESTYTRRERPIAISADGTTVAAVNERALPECPLATGYWQCRRYGSVLSPSPRVVVIDRASGAERLIVRGPDEVSQVVFAPDGSRVAIMARVVRPSIDPYTSPSHHPFAVDIVELATGAVVSYGEGPAPTIERP